MEQFDLFEEWRPLKGNEKYYISNYGRCKVIGRTITDKNGKVRFRKGRMLIPHDNGHGYMAFLIDGKHKYIHRLVALTFIPNYDKKPEIDHIDGNRGNNCVWNLRWVTKKENMANPMTKRRLSNSFLRQMKPIVQLTLDGEFVRIWNGIGEAAAQIGIRRTDIVSVLSDKRNLKTVNGWQFVYFDDYDEKEDYRLVYKNGTTRNANIPTQKMVIELDGDNIVKIHQNTSEAAKYYGFSFSLISKKCREWNKRLKIKREKRTFNKKICYFKDLPTNLKERALLMFKE